MHSQPIDWLSHKVGGVINFRIDTDPAIIPHETLRERRAEYMLQIRALMRSQKLTRRPRYPAGRWREYFGTNQEE